MIPPRAPAANSSGRTGYQTVSPRRLAIAAAIVLIPLTALAGIGVLIPTIAFFAVGAGAGYSLSGSV